MFINQKGSPLLHFSALCDIFRKRKIFENFKFFSKKNILRFLSLRYSADFRRSRLVFHILTFIFRSSSFSLPLTLIICLLFKKTVRTEPSSCSKNLGSDVAVRACSRTLGLRVSLKSIRVTQNRWKSFSSLLSVFT